MLHVEHVSKTFFPGTINEKKALQDLSLHLEPGDFATVIGGNGAGKSTTLNAIAGVFPIDKGKIIIDGEDITKEPEHKRAKYIGRVFQDPMLGTAAGMMIEENLSLAARRGETPGVVPNYVNGFIYGALVESFASEHNSRMMAMQAATDSAKEMLQTLSIEYNRVRQAAITQQITEVIGGAKAQKKKKKK